MVEHLKVLNSRAPKGPYGRAPKGPYQSSPLKGPYQSSLLPLSIYLLGGPSQISKKKGQLSLPPLYQESIYSIPLSIKVIK